MSAAEYLRTLAGRLSGDMVVAEVLKNYISALRACADLVEAVQSIDDISLCENHATCRHPVCHALSALESLPKVPK